MIPRTAGGANDPENLITLCTSCHGLFHERKGNPSAMMTELIGVK